MSPLSVFTYLSAVWKAATIYGPSFPNRERRLFLPAMSPSHLTGSSPRVSKGLGPGHSLLATIFRPQFTLFLLKKKSMSCKLGEIVWFFQKQGLGRQNMYVSVCNHTTPAGFSLCRCSIWQVPSKCDKRTLERLPKSFKPENAK